MKNTALKLNENIDLQSNVAPKDAVLSMAHIYVAFFSFLIGALGGLLQGLVRGGVIQLPSWLSYYQILTVHGILLAIVFTTYFIYAFFFAGISRTMGAMKDGVRKIGWIGYWVMTIGTLLTAVMVLLGGSSVLYTFYVPLQAHPLFYVGLTLWLVPKN